MEYNMERLTARRVRSIGITCFFAYAACYFGKKFTQCHDARAFGERGVQR